MKFCKFCCEEIATKDGENVCRECEDGLKKRKKARIQRREREAALRSLGLVKVRGALGGVYFE
jgi:hypothetical protein